MDINAALAKETEFFQEINFSLLVKEVGKIVFEAEYGRVEEFKKIKKPIEIEHEEKPNRERLGS